MVMITIQEDSIRVSHMVMITIQQDIGLMFPMDIWTYGAYMSSLHVHKLES